MITLEGRSFGPGNPMFVAEISCNHMGEYEHAEALIRAAQEAGADAVKFQAFTPDQMAPPDGPKLIDGPWKGWTLHELYERAQTPLEWLPRLFTLARSLDLIPFASVFHPDMVEALEELDPACYKIASGEAGWPELLKAVDATGKQIIFSDGCTPWRDVIGTLSGNPVVLRCVAEYPAHASKYSFRDLSETIFHWGLSDHSMAPVTWITAAALGASMIEAHLMLPDTNPLDYRHSLLPLPLKGHVRVARQAAQMAFGDPYQRKQPEFARRMLWAKRLDRGHVVTPEDMVCLRSPDGIDPYEAGACSGSKLNREVRQWEPVDMSVMRKGG